MSNSFINSNTLIEALNYRYATKAFDSSKKLTTEQLQTLKEALRLAPSSFGLQPWKFLIVENTELREKLKQASWGQPQVTDASHLIVLCTKNNFNAADVEKFVTSVATQRNMDVAALADYKNMMLSHVNALTPENNYEWCKKQTYIALGFLLQSAGLIGVDACPMEGFDKNAYDEILNLQNSDYKCTLVCPVGFRSENDQTASRQKVRYSNEEVFEHIK